MIRSQVRLTFNTVEDQGVNRLLRWRRHLDVGRKCRPPHADDPRFRTIDLRLQNEDALDEMLAQRCGDFPRDARDLRINGAEETLRAICGDGQFHCRA